MKIYFLSGLGADETVFHSLNLPGVEPVYLHWFSPHPKETLRAYAQRMAERIPEKDPILIGLSFGGIMAIEIAACISVKKIILISSIKTRKELPFYMRMCRLVPLHRLLPLHLVSRQPKLMGYFFGTRNSTQQERLKKIIEGTVPGFNPWAIDRLVNWKPDGLHKNLVHIHGNADHLLPHRYVKADHLIPNGSHFMIVHQAKEISALIQQALTKLPSSDGIA